MGDRRALPAYSFQHRPRETGILQTLLQHWLNSSGVCIQLLRWPGAKGTAPPCRQWHHHPTHTRAGHLIPGNSTHLGLGCPELTPAAALGDPEHPPARRVQGGNVQLSADSPQLQEALGGTGSASDPWDEEGRRWWWKGWSTGMCTLKYHPLQPHPWPWVRWRITNIPVGRDPQGSH